jgi:hypothetical protein
MATVLHLARAAPGEQCLDGRAAPTHRQTLDRSHPWSRVHGIAWRTALWRQFGAAIDTLDNALVACPASLWTQRLWPTPPPPPLPSRFAECWYVAFHALVWLDLYLAGVPEEEFAPPAPFAPGVLDSVEAEPERPSTGEELRAYLAATRRRCHTTLAALTDEQPHRPVEYPWSKGQPISYPESLLYNLRHGGFVRSLMLLRAARHAGVHPRA